MYPRPNLLLQAPPGAGKTTILPLALLTQVQRWQADAEEERLTDIVVVEPRRVATRSAAVRMAMILQEPGVGETVGYAIRGETRISKSRTRVTVMTDGVLLNRLRSDPELPGVDAVVFDEFHERGVNSDTALALCLEIQRLRWRPDLRLVVMSATLFDENDNDEGEGRLLRTLGGTGQCGIVRSSGGRQYPTEILWGPSKNSKRRSYPPLQVLLKSRKDLVEAMCDAIVDAALHAPARGDVLAFMPGAREIQLVIQELQNRNNIISEVLPLYGNLPKQQQDYAINPPPESMREKQRIIVSSPIAEASLTLERVTAVVDSGLRREPRCDFDTGMPRLITVPISKASATQRAGRAGRVQEGICNRIYSPGEYKERFPDHSMPETTSTDLVPTVLLLTDWGCSRPSEIYSMPFVDAPDETALQRAYGTLVALGILQEHPVQTGVSYGSYDEYRYSLTELGMDVCKLPTHPRLATAIVRAQTPQALVAAVVAAFLLDDDAGVRFSREADLRPRIRDILRGKTSGFVQRDVLQYAARMSDEANKAISSILVDSSLVDGVLREVGGAILPGFIDLVAQRKGDASYGGSAYLLSLGRTARLDDERDAPEFLVVAETTTMDDRQTRIRSFAPVDLDLLYQVAEEKDLTFTVPSRGYEVRSRRSLMVGSLELSSTPLPSPPASEVSKMLLNTIRSLGGVNRALLQNLAVDTRTKVDELRARVRLASSITAESTDWPPCFAALDAMDSGVATQQEIRISEELVEPWLASARSFRQLDMYEIMQSAITNEQQIELDNNFPVQIQAPDGSTIPIRYASGTPTASAKLQQFFGTTESPAVGPPENRIPVSLSLLSPAGKPLAQTTDLPFFWREAYPVVRSEMRGRYAKHPWPEDPMNAIPTRQSKKQQAAMASGTHASVPEDSGKKKKSKGRRR